MLQDRAGKLIQGGGSAAGAEEVAEVGDAGQATNGGRWPFLRGVLLHLSAVIWSVTAAMLPDGCTSTKDVDVHAYPWSTAVQLSG